MTPSKRKRLYMEAGHPHPGDLVALKRGHAFRTLPQARGSILRYSRENEVALVLGLDRFLEDMLLLTLGSDTLGWYDITEVMPCP